MTAAEAVAYIHSVRGRGKKMGLTKITELMHRLGDPQDRLKYVQVVGTNGKGSTTAMIAHVLTAAGYRTGMFISPFILDFRERMQVDGEMIPPEELAACVAEVKAEADRMEAEGRLPTEFELVCAAAFVWFARRQCEVVVLEAGIGGRLDSTNIVRDRLAAVICSIGLDHVEQLGDTPAKIAAEKCGILREGVPCICYPRQDLDALAVIMEQAAERQCPLVLGNPNSVEVRRMGLDGTDLCYRGLEIHLPLVGRYQVMNCVTAVETLLTLRSRGMNIPDRAIREGIAGVFFPARMEVAAREPLVLIDGAHNESGAAALGASLEGIAAGELYILIGMLADKDVRRSVEQTLPLARRVYAVQPRQNPRAMPSAELAGLAREFCPEVEDWGDRLEEAFAAAYSALSPGDTLLVCGSLYLAADLRHVARAFFESRGIPHSPNL
ncbi:MAG: bifunctional folylpolyglutamate synthase/dihydrofolate synthase [Clostridiales bacterium]|nr:bifunctional folylpolyglutamate synthase/dihydrofolate synthase [Clostridiales bacterium]